MKAIDVANFFVDMANCAPDDCMTNLRVNKLLYFAQAWSLVRRGTPLFEEDIEAWKFGPVVPSVYHAFKPCGRDRISEVSGEYSADIFSDDELEVLLDVVRYYGQYSSPALVNMTHADDSPWSEAYTEYGNNIISLESLFEYYSAQKPLSVFSLPEDFWDDAIDTRDPVDGVIILPKEWDDD